eukprot:TRINITY_DN2992_c0_g2_i1.p1 TRINITY_DN2992_c0_g2~~TRINITY_DN2992_c0_g2_i1.p1  ORF type:complete len:209 (+),score=51.74 TRINITY_DN2992_c0_g2_i1:293-919(+)
MLGPEGGRRQGANAGIIPQAVDEAFRRIAVARRENPESEYELRASYVEVYAGRVFDLFDESLTDRQGAKALTLTQGDNGTVKSSALEHVVHTTEALQEMISSASRRRVTEANTMHEHSSRSHALLSLVLEKRWPNHTGKGHHSLVTRLHMVDLAGSETFHEASAQNVAINEGLLALGKVLTALASQSSHIPYRDSPLTRLLQVRARWV